MKEKFSAFYRYSTEEELKKVWNDEKTLFVFDTNILLSIYSYNTQARNTFFSMLESLNGRVWLPFHVGLEYQRNRIKIIKEASSNLDKLKQRIGEFKDRLNCDEKKIEAINNDFRVVFDQHESLKSSFNQYVTDYKIFLDISKSDLTNKENEFFSKVDCADIEIMNVDGYDKIRDRFDEIFSLDKVGNCLFDKIEDINKFNEEAKKRFDNNIPPGFKDAEEKGDLSFFFGGLEYFNKYGDLIIFKELINKAKNDQNLIDSLIFVTDDSKEDWIEITKINGNKIKLGVLPLLKDEILRETGIKDFKIVDQQTFAEYCGKFLSSNDTKSVDNLISNIRLINYDKNTNSNEEFTEPDTIHFSKKLILESNKNIKVNADTLFKNFNNKESHGKFLNSLNKQIFIKEDFESVIKRLIDYSIKNSYFLSDYIYEQISELKSLEEEYRNDSEFLNLIIDNFDQYKFYPSEEDENTKHESLYLYEIKKKLYEIKRKKFKIAHNIIEKINEILDLNLDLVPF